LVGLWIPWAWRSSPAFFPPRATVRSVYTFQECATFPKNDAGGFVVSGRLAPQAKDRIGRSEPRSADVGNETCVVGESRRRIGFVRPASRFIPFSSDPIVSAPRRDSSITPSISFALMARTFGTAARRAAKPFLSPWSQASPAFSSAAMRAETANSSQVRGGSAPGRIKGQPSHDSP
jgi:hypothetical protein